MITTKIHPFVWYELMSTDVPGSLAYYERVVGLKSKPAGFGPVEYTLLLAGDVGIGGVFGLTEAMCQDGARPLWVGYIGVDDVDAASARVKDAGGKIHMGPMDLPEVGRFSMAADPFGAPFVLFKPKSTEPQPALAPFTPGSVGWRELHAGDGEKAWSFYSELFGWTKTEDMDMGPMGVYRLFATGAEPVGGMMTRMPESPAPMWLYYFNVESAAAGAQRAVEAGGTLLNGPMEVPGPMYVVQCLDPIGAPFAMVAGKP